MVVPLSCVELTFEASSEIANLVLEGRDAGLPGLVFVSKRAFWTVESSRSLECDHDQQDSQEGEQERCVLVSPARIQPLKASEILIPFSHCHRFRAALWRSGVRFFGVSEIPLRRCL